MTILDKIIRDKRQEVTLRKNLIPTTQLESSVLFNRTGTSMAELLRNSKSGIIAEHKRRSPSKAVINQQFSVFDVITGYENAGVCGISVLTDGKYFGGSLDDLLTARATTNIPLLRKEFIIDEYQLLEAKAFGADVILLIAAVLERKEIQQLSTPPKNLGLVVLLELHNPEEREKLLMPSIDLLGVNNRNLKTFEVSIDTSKDLASAIPDEFVKVSESGISSTEAIKELQNYGYQGFLIGEHFMKTEHAGNAATSFIQSLQS